MNLQKSLDIQTTSPKSSFLNLIKMGQIDLLFTSKTSSFLASVLGIPKYLEARLMKSFVGDTVKVSSSNNLKFVSVVTNMLENLLYMELTNCCICKETPANGKVINEYHSTPTEIIESNLVDPGRILLI